MLVSQSVCEGVGRRGLGGGEIQTVGFPKLQEVVYERETLLQTGPAKVLCSQDSVTKEPSPAKWPCL